MRLAVRLSSFRSWVLAVSVYSIVQAKLFPHVRGSMHSLSALTDAFENVGGQVVVLHIL